MARKAPHFQTEKRRGQFATSLANKLQELDMTVMDLAVKLEMTYEHIRKMCKGVFAPNEIAFPTWDTLNRICKITGLNATEMQELIIADKMELKYGGIPAKLAGKSARFTRIERLLPNITDEQFQIVLGQLEGWDKNNRKQQKH